MRVHDLLADVPFACLGRWATILGWTVLVVASWHLLHLHVRCNRFLTIDLADKALHAFSHWLANLSRHVGNHVNYFFLTLLGLIVCFYHVANIVILRFFKTLHIFNIESLALHVARGKFFRKIGALQENIVSLERIYWEFCAVYKLMLIHLRTDSVTEFGPFLLILIILGLESLIALLEQVTLFFDHIELFSQLLTFDLLLLDVQVKLVDSFLELVDFNLQSFFLFLKIFLNLKYLYVDHFILLNLRYKLFLC